MWFMIGSGGVAGDGSPAFCKTKDSTHMNSGNKNLADDLLMNNTGSSKARPFAYQEDWGNLTPAQINAMRPIAADYSNSK
jgi:hypothetical protein